MAGATGQSWIGGADVSPGGQIGTSEIPRVGFATDLGACRDSAKLTLDLCHRRGGTGAEKRDQRFNLNAFREFQS